MIIEKGSTNTTCPVVLFYSLCLVAMMIMIQEYRKYKDDLSCSPLLFSLCGGVMIIKIQEYRKYKDDLSCSPLLFSLFGGHDN
jgi:hypothetical protein